jgi:hypothetical protein
LTKQNGESIVLFDSAREEIQILVPLDFWWDLKKDYWNVQCESLQAKTVQVKDYWKELPHYRSIVESLTWWWHDQNHWRFFKSPVMYRAESWVGWYNWHLPSHKKGPCIEAHLIHVLNACLLCTTMHNLIPTQCWTLEIFRFTCDSITANLFFSPFHTMDCGNWSAYTSKQAGMHLANLRWCFLWA